jgi:hypothetical protein
LPEPIPPVSPTRSTVQRYAAPIGRQDTVPVGGAPAAGC